MRILVVEDEREIAEFHFDSFTNVIDVSTNHLRSKVGRDFPRSSSRTSAATS